MAGLLLGRPSNYMGGFSDCHDLLVFIIDINGLLVLSREWDRTGMG